ncbi:MAG: tetratricopeptide repeat protein [Bacteroidota bacterium]
MLLTRLTALFILLWLSAVSVQAQLEPADIDTMISRYRRLSVDSLRVLPMREALSAARSTAYEEGASKVLFDQGMAFFRDRNYDSALTKVNSALSGFLVLNDTSRVRACLNQLGIIKYFLGDCRAAIDHYTEFMRMAAAVDHREDVASAHLNLALCWNRLEQWDSAAYHFEKSRLLRRVSGNVDKELKATRLLSSLYYAQDQFDTARSLLESVLLYDDGSRDSSQFALMYFDLGRIAYRMSDLVEALRYYQEAYARRNQDFLVDAYYQNVGLIYSAIDDHHRAIDYYRQALQLRRSRRDSIGMGESYQALGGSLLSLEMDSAEWYYTAALGIFERHERLSALSSLHENMGYYYYVMYEYEPAKYHYRQCLAIGDRAETQADIYLARAYLGKIAQTERQYEMAEEYLLSSHQWFTEKGIKNYAGKTCGFLGDLYADLGRFEQAYEARLREIELSQEILSAQNITEIAVLRYQMTLEQEEETARLLQAEREKMYEANLSMARLIRNIAIGSVIVSIVIIIYILRLVTQRRKINQDLNRQNERLNALANDLTETLKEKEVLYKEIHHRVKNNLQIILSLLNSALVMVEDEESRDVLQQSRNRVNSMALIHKNLYQSENMEKVHAQDYIKEIVREIEQSFGAKRASAQINTHVEDVFLELNLAIPVGLILNELITNAFKYAFGTDRPNEMDIHLRRLSPDSYRIEVKDNGPGLPQGFSPLVSEKLGFQLIQGLTRQINGEFHYHSNGGLMVRIDFRSDG